MITYGLMSISNSQKKLQHILTVLNTTDATAPATGALVVAGGIACGGSLRVGGQIQTTGSLSNTSTLPSTSSTTGSLVLSGGLGISNTTDSVDYTNGGAITASGGAAIGGRLLVNNGIVTRSQLTIATQSGATDGGTLTLGYAGNSTLVTSAASSWNFRVESDKSLIVRNRDNVDTVTDILKLAETTGQLSVKSKQTATLVTVNPNREDVHFEQTFTSSSDVVSTATSVTNLVFTNSRAFECELVAYTSATAPLCTIFKLFGTKSGNGTWDLSVDAFGRDAVPYDFTITSGGQVQYTKTTTAGHTSHSFKWRTRAYYD